MAWLYGYTPGQVDELALPDFDLLCGWADERLKGG